MNRKPFPETLSTMLAERDWSQRELARRTRKEAGWGSSFMVSRFIAGGIPPTREAMEIIARVMRTRPEHFPEYRLDVARDALDWRRHGVAKALRALEARQRRPRRRTGTGGR